jgi:hypothetical protein
MRPQYHILNGDALLEQFPANIPGERMVARECLVDGDLEGDTLEAFYRSRAQFISRYYSGYTPEDYYRQTVAEFGKIQHIPKGVDVNLWFEDDLFCQVNFWFVTHLLHRFGQGQRVFLIRPRKINPYGFGGLGSEDLRALYEQRIRMTNISEIAALWDAYRAGNAAALQGAANTLCPQYPFIWKAVQAHLDRDPVNPAADRPKQVLLAIIEELQTEAFGPVFKAFCEREPIYGFGDLQVRRLLRELRAGR